jgi:L-rhamnose mutarotase
MAMAERIAFRMALNAGQAQEYKRRHDEIWPELVDALRAAGVSDYSIWLDPQTHHLFATLVRSDAHTMERLPDTEIVQRWWAMMGDIMETHPDNAPVEVALQNVFHMP